MEKGRQATAPAPEGQLAALGPSTRACTCAYTSPATPPPLPPSLDICKAVREQDLDQAALNQARGLGSAAGIGVLAQACRVHGCKIQKCGVARRPGRSRLLDRRQGPAPPRQHPCASPPLAPTGPALVGLAQTHPASATQVVAQHLYHEGHFDIGDAFVEEAGLAQGGALKAPYASMHGWVGGWLGCCMWECVCVWWGGAALGTKAGGFPALRGCSARPSQAVLPATVLVTPSRAPSTCLRTCLCGQSAGGARAP